MERIKQIICALFISGFILIASTMNAQKTGNSSDPEKDGYVPTAVTAIAVAEAIWLPIYGNKIYESKPFKATLRNNEIWIVEGTLHTQRGGVPYAEIQKKDCKVVKVIHTK